MVNAVNRRRIENFIQPAQFGDPFGMHRRAASTRSNVSDDIGVIRVERDPEYCGRSKRCRFVWKSTVSVPATKPCCLNLTFSIDPSLVLIKSDGMKHVFDYDPLVAEIDRLARDGHYDTQEWLISRIARACAAYTEITCLVIGLHKHPVRDGSGALGVRLELNTNDLADLR
jgi:dihydroneopterin aldolase